MKSLVVVALASSVAAAQPGVEPAPAPEPDATSEPGTTSEPESAPQAAAEPEPPKPRRKTPFDRGRFGLSAGAGTGSAFGGRYYAIGASAAYFVLDGVALGLGSQVQWGSGPTILRTTPELRYVAQPLVGRSPLIPYIAGFYTHWFIGDAYLDVDAIGTRGGLLYVSGSIVLGLGIGYEHIVNNCPPDAAGMPDCDSVYPDLTISIAF